jgi:hypothetical protein
MNGVKARFLRFVWCFSLVTGLSASAAESIRHVGVLPGKTTAKALGISADGNSVVGVSGGAPFRYSVQTSAMTPLDTSGEAVAVSGDGSLTVVNAGAVAYVYNGSGQRVTLRKPATGFTTVTSIAAYGTSLDGQYVAGRVNETPVYWQRSASGFNFNEAVVIPVTEFTDGPLLRGTGRAVGINGTRVKVVGNYRGSNSPAVENNAFELSVGSFLQRYTGGNFFACSSDGSVLVGRNTSSAFSTKSGPLANFQPLDFTASTALDVSANGDIIVGGGTTPAGREAFVWDPLNNWRKVGQLLSRAGIDMTGWVLEEATGISDDGRTIAGFGKKDGIEAAWLATIVVGDVAAPKFSQTSFTVGLALGESLNLRPTASGSGLIYSATNLPAGLSIDPATGLISGSITTSGIYTVGLRASNNGGTDSASLVLTVGNPIFTSALAVTGSLEVPFSFQVSAQFASSFAATGLPPGFVIQQSGPMAGRITGFPSVEGVFDVSITARNGNASTVSSLKITIGPPAFGFRDDGIILGKVGNPFEYIVATENAVEVFSAVNLPAGLSIEAGSGRIRGTPTVAGVRTATVMATRGGVTGQFDLTFAIEVQSSDNDFQGLVISSITGGGNWTSFSYFADIVVGNPNTRLSRNGYIRVLYRGSEVSRVPIPPIPGGGSYTVPRLSGVLGEEGFARQGQVYAVLHEGPANTFQDSALITEFFDYDTLPPSGGATLPNAGIEAPGFTVAAFTGVAVEGPAEFSENTVRVFKARAVFSDGGSREVAAKWDSSVFTINSSGALSAGNVSGVPFQNVRVIPTVTIGGVTKTGTKTVRVNNTTPVVTMAVLDGFAREDVAADTAAIRITRTGGTESDLVVRFQVSGTAAEGEDFTGIPGAGTSRTFTIPAGRASILITITALPDDLFEDNETIEIQLLPTGGAYELGVPSSGTVTIIGTAAVQLSGLPLSARESSATVGVEVVRTGPTDQAASVDYEVRAGTAKDGVDFISTTGTLQFSAGQQSATIPVQLLDDAVADGDRTIEVELKPPAIGAALGNPVTLTVQIIDDEFKNFKGVSGRYSGLGFEGLNGDTIAGGLKITVLPSGVFTGSLVVKGVKQSLRGKLNVRGESRELAIGDSPMKLTFRISDVAVPRISGELAVPATGLPNFTVANFLLDRAATWSKSNPVPAAALGKHTFLLNSAIGPDIPGGTSYGSFIVKPNGAVRAIGVLADGTKLSFSSELIDVDRFWFQSSLYRKRGYLAGRIVLEEISVSPPSDEARARWVRLEDPSANAYPGGWPDGLDLVVRSSKYVPPAAATKKTPAVPLFPALSPNETTHSALLSIGLSTQSLNLGALIKSNGLIGPGDGNGFPFTLTLNRATGIFTGKLTRTEEPKLLKFGGATLRDGNVAEGFVLENGKSYPVLLTIP